MFVHLLAWITNNKPSLLLRSSADTYKAPLEATLTRWLLLNVSEMDRVADVTPAIVWHLYYIRNWSNKRAFYVSVSHSLYHSVLHFISAWFIFHCFFYYITYQDFIYCRYASVSHTMISVSHKWFQASAPSRWELRSCVLLCSE